MVSFSCEGCGDVLTKKKLDPHRNQCYGASYTCLDCMVHFQGSEYRAHTSCISEAQKYQGALYRPEKEKKGRQNNQSNSNLVVSHKAYVEDADDESNPNTHIEIVNLPMPEAPEPPSAAPGFVESSSPAGPVNVFDFLVASTPNASNLNLPAPEPMQMIEGGADDHDDDHEEDTSRSLVRVRFEDGQQRVDDLIEYGSGPVPSARAQFETPAPKERRERREKKDREHKGEKKDKKRKRLHVETHDLDAKDNDETMTDAPPVLHSGLTGGLNRLLSRPSVFPPSPDYSGGDVADASPGSPIKKSKHSKKRGRVDAIGNGIMSLITTSKSREHSEDRPKRKHRKHRETSERPAQKMLEYKPLNGEVQENGSQMIIFQPRSSRAEHLLSFISKGPESDRGVSMNKALKRYHRERVAMGVAAGKAAEEKELWKNLRMKRNDRGEIVLFQL